jgi:PKD domain
MRRHPISVGRSRWAVLAIALVSAVALFVVTSGAQAVVVDMNPAAAGQTTVNYPSDQSYYYGVALVPGTRGSLATAGVPTVSSSAPCTDPWLSNDLTLSNAGLCWHGGGSVIHSNETFALTWNAQRTYWSGTQGYVEQFLRDVASASGSLNDPYAVTPQYQDGGGRAGNSSVYAGGCVDNGSVGGSFCNFGNPTGAGHDYPANGCTPSGGTTVCLTDGQLQGELATMIAQSGVIGHTQPGFTPLVVLLTPNNVETCLNATGTLCSVNSNAPARFCSYHSQVNVGGTEVAYVVQPWSAFSTCDEPDVPTLGSTATPQAVAQNAGMRLVSPLSQAEMGAITDPAFNGWFALDGSEMNDNGCVPENQGADAVGVGSNSYFLQREFNNAAAIVSDPDTYGGCAPNVFLSPTFVVPSAVNPGDVVEFDGSATASTLIVPNAGYAWDFGDGAGATGPSVEHSYAKGGNYNVKLTVTDRGGNVQTLVQTISVLGPNGLPVPPTPAPTTANNEGSSGALHVHLQLRPQSLRNVLSSGILVQVNSSEPANGIATVSIARATAKRAHIRTGRGPSVVIGRGTVASIKDGTMTLRFKLSRGTAAKLKHLRHVTFTIRLALTAGGQNHLAVDAAGRY